MKHNFLKWRYLDTATEPTGGSGALVKAIEENRKLTTEQIEGIKTQHKKELDDLKAEHLRAIEELKKAGEEVKKANEEDIGKAKAEAKAAADKVADLEKKMSTAAFRLASGAGVKSTGEELLEKLSEESHKKALQSKTPNYGIELERKAVGDMSSSGNLTGSYLVPPEVKPGIVLRPYEQVHLRQLLPIGSTSSNIIRHLRDNGGEGGPDMVAEAGTKPQLDRDLSIEDAPVRKIATYIRIPEEMIEDIPYLVSFIQNIGVEEMMAVEDDQILYGDGTGQNLDGLFTNATAFDEGASANTIEDANEFDVLRAARKQMRILKRVPSFALVSPTDYFQMTSHKDKNNNYILQGGGNGLIPALDGVPIIEMNQIADGDFLLVDRRAAEIDFRQNVVIRFFDQDRDNAIKNMVTVVIEERLALPIYYTDGLVKGTFTAAKAALETA
jgi:HK97 family phage major capsid protein